MTARTDRASDAAAPDATEDLLRRRSGDGAAWAAARDRLAARASAEALVDVAFEDHDTPLGTMRAFATRAGVVRLVLPAEDADAVTEELAARLSPRLLRGDTAPTTRVRRELDEYFAGRRRAFDVALDWSLSRAFRREVLEATARIPYGETRSYRGVATAAGRPAAVRAAGTALATNPLPIVVPCHRVVRSDGSIGAYLGGAATKERLLGLEASHERAPRPGGAGA